MKRKLVTLVTLLMACTLMVCLAYATTSSKTASGYKDKNYVLTITGSSSVLTAQGTDELAYTVLRNTSTTTMYGWVTVSYTNYINSLGDDNSKSAHSLGYNSVVTVNIERYPSNSLMEYEHYGKLCKYVNGTTLVDELTYLVKQR